MNKISLAVIVNITIILSIKCAILKKLNFICIVIICRIFFTAQMRMFIIMQLKLLVLFIVKILKYNSIGSVNRLEKKFSS